MAEIKHPTSLNPWQQYRQAISILKHTSRASNPAWYQRAMELDLQWHIRVDGTRILSYYFDKSQNTWSDGPKLKEQALLDAEIHGPIVDEVLAYAKAQKKGCIGIILHIADEFATAELNPELDNPGSLAELADQAINEPAKILEDTSTDPKLVSCRIMPYAAAGSDVIGTTIALSRRYDPFIDTIRNKSESANFPMITQSVSAPLVAMMGLDSMLPPNTEKPFVSILQYPWFTVLAFFNEHADLKLIRTLQHRGLRKASNFRNALFTTSAQLEFMDPNLYIVPLGEDIDSGLETELKQNFPASEVRALQPPQNDSLPAWSPEPIIINQTPGENASVSSMTFTSLQEDQWALQDFLPRDREHAEIYPSRMEMGMLRITRMVRVLIVLLALGGLSFFGWKIFTLTQKEAWQADASKSNIATARLQKLSQEQTQIDHWNNLLADRSKAWVAMESFARMFPENSDMLIISFQHTINPDNMQGQGQIGFVKQWRIAGLAREPAMEYLNNLGTRSGITEHFTKIADATGNDAYRPDIGNRSIEVNIRTRENPLFRPVPFDEVVMADTTTYPLTFDLIITQRFESTDPLAITVRAAK
ncbi:MAG: hypothetical protein R3242_00690 [Akkermansiaceae bacterium]|nr:hypothetical protein [Akkermansiaceae bacterium]